MTGAPDTLTTMKYAFACSNDIFAATPYSSVSSTFYSFTNYLLVRLLCLPIYREGNILILASASVFFFFFFFFFFRGVGGGGGLG